MPAPKKGRLPRSQQAAAFGRILRATREKKGLSQETLGLTMGSARVYIGEVERGEKAPGLEFIFKAAEILETTPSALLRRTEKLIDKVR